MVAAKPECSIAELRRIERKGRKEKILPGFQPGSSDFRSPLKCNFKSHKLSLFPLCASPRGIKPLSFQYWAVPKKRVPRLLFSIPRVSLSAFHLKNKKHNSHTKILTTSRRPWPPSTPYQPSSNTTPALKFNTRIQSPILQYY